MGEKMNLKNKTIIVTGASEGIGKEICEHLAEEGANIVAVSRSRAGVVDDINHSNKGRAIWVKCDVSKEKQFENVFKIAKKKYKKINGLVNNAGILFNHPKKLIEKTPFEEFYLTMMVNAGGVWIGCKLAKKYIKKGVVVNAGSVAGLPGMGSPKLSAYNGSKFAIIGMTNALAKEFGKDLRVYAVAPHRVATKMGKFIGNPPQLIARKYIQVLKETAGIKPGQYVIAGTKKGARCKTCHS